jgi:hypothetical protein
MGFYWTTLLYEGNIIETEDTTVPKTNTIQISGGKWIVFRRCITMACMDPVLGKEEIEQKFVDEKELERWLDMYPKLKENWNDETKRDDSISSTGLYIAQLSMSSLEDYAKCIPILEYNLPVQ